MHPGEPPDNQNEARYDTIVLLILLAVILALELTIRAFEDRLSGDIEHIFRFPDIVSQASDSPGSLLFIGNSLTKDGYDASVIDAKLTETPEAGLSSSYKLVPDGTAISDWYCIYRNNVAGIDQPPAHVILSFAWNQLSDQYQLNISRLGGFFCESSDLDGLSHAGLDTIETRLGFFTSKLSHVYVNREAIRNRVLSMAIPGYERTTQRMNRIDRERAASSAGGELSYRLLESLIDDIEAEGSQLTIVAMPVRQRFDLDPQLLRLMSSRGINFLDMRYTIELSKDNYKDRMHLNEQGSARFSELMIDRLLKTVKPYDPQSVTD